MAELTKFFPSTAPEFILSLDFAQVAAGTGVIDFWAGRTVDKNIISNISFFSDTIHTRAADMGTSSIALRLDIDFDILINTQIIIEGTAIVSVPLSALRSGTRGYVIVKFRKIPFGGSEEDIAENQSTITENSAGGTEYLMTSTDLTIPNTQFSRGDVMRLTIELWGSGEGTPSFVGFAHDPKSRIGTWDSTGDVPSILTLQLPVRSPAG